MLKIRIHLRAHLARLASGPGVADRVYTRRLAEPTTIRDAVEALGVPHCEIGRVKEMVRLPRDPKDPSSLVEARIGGERDQLDAVRDHDWLVVLPARPRALDEPRFLCDRHLGKLARLLRILGFDVLLSDGWEEPDLVDRALAGGRAVLSRSRSLLKRREMDLAQLVRANDPEEQLAEVIARWLLAPRVRWFGRCSRCNGLLNKVAKPDVADRIPPKTARWLDEYYLCAGCDQLYWKGTHVSALTGRLEKILARFDEDGRPTGTR